MNEVSNLFSTLMGTINHLYAKKCLMFSLSHYHLMPVNVHSIFADSTKLTKLTVSTSIYLMRCHVCVLAFEQN